MLPPCRFVVFPRCGGSLQQQPCRRRRRLRHTPPLLHARRLRQHAADSHARRRRRVAGASARRNHRVVAAAVRRHRGVQQRAHGGARARPRESPRVGTAQGHGVRVAERGLVTDLSMHLVMDDGSGSVDVKGASTSRWTLHILFVRMAKQH